MPFAESFCQAGSPEILMILVFHMILCLELTCVFQLARINELATVFPKSPQPADRSRMIGPFIS